MIFYRYKLSFYMKHQETNVGSVPLEQGQNLSVTVLERLSESIT